LLMTSVDSCGSSCCDLKTKQRTRSAVFKLERRWSHSANCACSAPIEAANSLHQHSQIGVLILESSVTSLPHTRRSKLGWWSGETKQWSELLAVC
jgi:hypothetical protein